MGSISTVEDEAKVYDAINRIAHKAVLDYGLPVIFRDTRRHNSDTPEEYVYFEQIHGAYDKRTLSPGRYDVDVEFICEINVDHDKLAKGREMSKRVQRTFHKTASSCGLVVTGSDATDVVTTSGHKFVTTLTLTYTTIVV